MIFVAGRWGAWAHCLCGWKGGAVAFGAGGASISWAMHVRAATTTGDGPAGSGGEPDA